MCIERALKPHPLLSKLVSIGMPHLEKKSIAAGQQNKDMFIPCGPSAGLQRLLYASTHIMCPSSSTKSDREPHQSTLQASDWFQKQNSLLVPPKPKGGQGKPIEKRLCQTTFCDPSCRQSLQLPPDLSILSFLDVERDLELQPCKCRKERLRREENLDTNV